MNRMEWPSNALHSRVKVHPSAEPFLKPVNLVNPVQAGSNASSAALSAIALAKADLSRQRLAGGGWPPHLISKNKARERRTDLEYHTFLGNQI